MTLKICNKKKRTCEVFMPFRSRAQQAYLFAKEPSVAKEFAEHTPKSAYKKLPEHVKDKNGLKKYSKKYRRKSNG
jgi:hypothetical protein